MQGDTKALIRRFCMEATPVGLKYWYLYPDVVTRIFWVINYVFAYGTAGVLLVSLYDHFSDMPTRITIENQYEPLKNLSLPAITFCSPMQLSVEGMAKVAKMLNTPSVAKLDVAVKLLFHNADFGNSITYDELEEIDRLVNQSHYNTNDILYTLPQRCEDYLKLCMFRGKVRDCKTLFRPILTFRGLCCAFNNVYHISDTHVNKKNPRFRAHEAGDFVIGTGLQIVLEFEPQKAMNSSIMNGGVSWVTFNSWSEFPSESQLFAVHGDAEVMLCLRATFTFCSKDVEQLPYWGRKCYFQDEENLPYFGGYHNEDCDNLCLINAVKEKCDCLMFYVPNAKPTEVCNFTNLPCIEWTRANIEKWYNSSQCECPRDCQATTYQVSSDVGNLNALNTMIHPLPVPMKTTSTLVWIFMQRPVYKKQKQETTVSIISVIANLGGVFGLCLGCSLMTIAEIAFYIYSAIKNKMAANRVNKQVLQMK